MARLRSKSDGAGYKPRLSETQSFSVFSTYKNHLEYLLNTDSHPTSSEMLTNSTWCGEVRLSLTSCLHLPLIWSLLQHRRGQPCPTLWVSKCKSHSGWFCSESSRLRFQIPLSLCLWEREGGRGDVVFIALCSKSLLQVNILHNCPLLHKMQSRAAENSQGSCGNCGPALPPVHWTGVTKLLTSSMDVGN